MRGLLFEVELVSPRRLRAIPGRRKGRSYIPIMEDNRPLRSVPDDELLHRLAELMGQSRRVEADIVAHIAEVEERRLYAREAFPSMFAYCMEVLHLSEAEAYLRILAARASRSHPVLLAMLTDGRLHLTAIVKLAPHLTCENRELLLERATYLSKRQILELVAEIAPRPDVPAVVRKLPERRVPMASPLVVPGHGDGVMPGLGPDPRLGLEAKTEMKPDSPPSSRHIPAPIRRAVYERDGGRCRYVDEQGRRCPEQNRLEFHHLHPFGLGGDHSVANVGLICHAHNAYLAECDYARKAMDRHRRTRSRVAQPATG